MENLSLLMVIAGTGLVLTWATIRGHFMVAAAVCTTAANLSDWNGARPFFNFLMWCWMIGGQALIVAGLVLAAVQ